MKYLIIIEPTQTGYSAYSPDIPGCIATGDTEQDTRSNIIDAVAFHLEGVAMHGQVIPSPVTKAEYIEIAA